MENLKDYLASFFGPNDLLEWLQVNGFSKYCKNFETQKMDFWMLLVLTRNEFGFLGIESNDIPKFEECISRLYDYCCLCVLFRENNCRWSI